MHGSRRFWLLAALGAALAGVAVLVARPVPLVGAAGIGAWLLAVQLRTVRAFQQSTALDVTYVTETRHVAVERPIRCRLVAERPAPVDTAVDLTAPVPLAADGPDRDARTVRLAPGETRAATTFELRFSVAGRFTFDAPEVQLAEPLGLFTETLARGDAPTVEVAPEGPRDIHVGRGGDRRAGAYGEHTASHHGTGLQPEELREYVAGDPANSIDWKATARLNQPYVREFQAETDRETVLIVDHRAAMAVGSDGETMLAYAREVALAVAAAAIEMADPLGLYTVGDEGLTTRRATTTVHADYETIRSRLRALEPTGGRSGDAPAGRPARARRMAMHLADDRSEFATRLRPFLTATNAYVEQLSGDPLFGAIRTACPATATDQWTVIVTSDTDPGRLREAVRLAAQRSASVLVLLTPRVLFDADVADLDAAYDRYVAFEDLRRDLDRLPGVTALEVGPGDRIDRLLARRQAKTTRS